MGGDGVGQKRRRADGGSLEQPTAPRDIDPAQASTPRDGDSATVNESGSRIASSAAEPLAERKQESEPEDPTLNPRLCTSYYFLRKTFPRDEEMCL